MLVTLSEWTVAHTILKMTRHSTRLVDLWCTPEVVHKTKLSVDSVNYFCFRTPYETLVDRGTEGKLQALLDARQ